MRDDKKGAPPNQVSFLENELRSYDLEEGKTKGNRDSEGIFWHSIRD